MAKIEKVTLTIGKDDDLDQAVTAKKADGLIPIEYQHHVDGRYVVFVRTEDHEAYQRDRTPLKQRIEALEAAVDEIKDKIK